LKCSCIKAFSKLKAFIKAELLRYNRTNTALSDILKIREQFWFRLRKRGYPPQFLKLAFCTVEPHVSISTQSCKQKSENNVVFCTTYHSHFLSREYLLFLKQAFSSNAKIYYRKTKQLFY